LVAYVGFTKIEQLRETYMDQLAFSVREAGARARIGRTLLYEHIRPGRLLARKLGHRALILAEDLEKWLHELPQIRVTKDSSHGAR
jgi:excisionase family DNA binding protein